MDFLIDVNASGAVACWLRDRGHDVAKVGQTEFRIRKRCWGAIRPISK